MLYLSGHAGKKVQAARGLGFLLTPEIGNKPDLSKRPWAADTGCFTLGDTFSLGKYISWLERMAKYQSTCLFATAPDIVGNAEETWKRSKPILPLLRAMGWKAALVAQNGIEHMAIEWDAFDVLFIGGSTKWKLSPMAARLVHEAKLRGKWVHMGRVNSLRRLRIAEEMGCDSVDGTYLKFGPDANLPKMQEWVKSLQRQTSMWTHDMLLQPKRADKAIERVDDIFSELEIQLHDAGHRLAAVQHTVPITDQRYFVETLMLVDDLSDHIAGWAEAASEWDDEAEAA